MTGPRGARGGTTFPTHVGPDNALWMIACHRGTAPPEPYPGDGAPHVGTGTATTTNVERMLWRYAHRSTPGKVWRMNGAVASAVGSHEGSPPVVISVFAQACTTVGSATTATGSPAVLALCGHGLVMTGTYNTRWLCLHSGWDNQFTDSVERQTAWDGYCLPFNWPARSRNTAYTQLANAIRAMSNVSVVHLYACGMDAGLLSSPMPIGAFAQDIGKEVWAFSGLLNVASNGSWIRVIENHASSTPMWGVRETSANAYEGVLLNCTRGVMDGWQIRALPDGSVDRLDVGGMGGTVEHFTASGSQRGETEVNSIPMGGGAPGGLVL